MDKTNNNSINKYFQTVVDNNKEFSRSKKKSRRSNTAYFIRKSNRSKRHQKRKTLFRMVRTPSPVLAPQEIAYHGAQEDTANLQIHKTEAHRSNKLQGSIQIGTYNCKGANYILVREKLVHIIKKIQLYRYFISTGNPYQHKYRRKP